MQNENAYLRTTEEWRRDLPGEVIRHSTTTRSSGSAKYSIQGDSWTIERPTPEDVALMLGGLSQPYNGFATLIANPGDPSKYIGSCSYIQTAIVGDDDSDRGKGKYIVEAQFIYGWVKGKRPTEQTDYTQKQFRTFIDDVGELQKMFTAFVAGVVPDVGGWLDVSDDRNHVADPV